MARESTKVISVRLDVGNYEKLQKMAVINKSTISAVASEVINSSFDDIERVDKRVEHLEELVFSVLDHLTLMQAFNKEVYTTLLVRKARSLSEEEKKAAVKDFNFPKGIVIALLAGFMSGCFNVGLSFGENVSFAESSDMFKTLPATFLVTLGGFVTNAIYCFYQNTRNKTWCDYGKTAVWGNNLMFCLLAGALWYSQFFGLSLGKGFLTDSPVLTTFSFCILMALNVVFSNVWGIILKEWKGCSPRTIGVLTAGIVILIISSFLPQLI